MRMESLERVELIACLPQVFAERNDVHSEVWLQHVTLDRGKHYLVKAQSGAGKTSLCAYLYGSRNDYSGTIKLGGLDARSLTIAQWSELRRRHLAFVPQTLGLFGELTVLENVELKNAITGYKTRNEIEQMLAQLGLSDKLHSLVSRLSVGQQQRVAIVRAMCQPCDLMLLDEPVSHLDADNNRAVADLVTQEASRQGAAVVVTSVGNHLMIDIDHILNL